MSDALTDNDLEPGDILLCKNYGAIPLWSMNGKHVYIRAMQSVTTHNIHGGSSNSVHAAMAFEMVNGKMTVFESTGDGIVQAEIRDEAIVFRPRKKVLGNIAEIAVGVAERLFQEKKKS